MELEEMSSFFNSRSENYEQHMMNNVEGTNELYSEIAKINTKNK